MTLERTGELVAAAAAGGFAVPAFNVISMEHAEAVVLGAALANTPTIVQVSENAIRYHGAMEPILAACRELARAAPVPIALHLDHIEDLALLDHALDIARDYGVGSIMFDASTMGYDDNEVETSRVASRAHALDLWVEAELGAIGGKDGAHAPGVRTDPDEALAFVQATGVDALAVAVGSSHAMTDKSASIDVELVSRLAAAVPVPLVLHGSSGVPDDALALAVVAGIRKINVGTALNVAFTAALRSELDGNPSAVDPRRYTRSPREAMVGVVEHLCRVLARAG